jgi:hypothetical protein
MGVSHDARPPRSLVGVRRVAECGGPGWARPVWGFRPPHPLAPVCLAASLAAPPPTRPETPEIPPTRAARDPGAIPSTPPAPEAIPSARRRPRPAPRPRSDPHRPARSGPPRRPPARSDPAARCARPATPPGRGASRSPRSFVASVVRVRPPPARRDHEARRIRLRPSPALAGPRATREGSGAVVARGPPRGRRRVHMGGCAHGHPGALSVRGWGVGSRGNRRVEEGRAPEVGTATEPAIYAESESGRAGACDDRGLPGPRATVRAHGQRARVRRRQRGGPENGRSESRPGSPAATSPRGRSTSTTSAPPTSRGAPVRWPSMAARAIAA